MNKLVVKEFDYINGNTAINPNRKVNEPERDKQYEDLRKSKIDRDKRLKEKQKNNRRAATQVIVLIFVLGIGTIWRDVQVYKAQAELTQIDSNISELNAENESLKADLLKASSLDDIKSTAESKLGMVVPSNGDILRVDSNVNYFSANSEEKTVEKKSSFNLLLKLKEMLF